MPLPGALSCHSPPRGGVEKSVPAFLGGGAGQNPRPSHASAACTEATGGRSKSPLPGSSRRIELERNLQLGVAYILAAEELQVRLD